MVRACCVQQILRLARQGLEQPLDARDVAGGLRQSARELLDRGIAIELERIEIVAARILLVLMPVQHLRLGLDLQPAQLLLQARHRARELGQVEIDRVHLLIEARAEDAHLAGVVEHGVEQLGIDARHLDPLRGHVFPPRQHRTRARLELGSLELGGFELRSLEVRNGVLGDRGRRRFIVRLRYGGRRWRHRARRGGLGRRGVGRRRRCGRRRRRGRNCRALRRGSRGRPIHRRRGNARRKAADLREQRMRRRGQLAGAHQIAHAGEFVETGLHQRRARDRPRSRPRRRSGSPASRARGSNRPWR